MNQRVVEWLKRALLWVGATLLCIVLLAILVFAKFSKDLGAAHETFRIGEILAPVAVGKAIKSGEDVGTFSLDEPIVGLATQLSVDELSIRTWRFHVSPISTEPEMYGVTLYEGNNAAQFWSGAASAKSSGVQVIVDSK